MRRLAAAVSIAVICGFHVAVPVATSKACFLRYSATPTIDRLTASRFDTIVEQSLTEVQEADPSLFCGCEVSNHWGLDVMNRQRYFSQMYLTFDAEGRVNVEKLKDITEFNLLNWEVKGKEAAGKVAMYLKDRRSGLTVPKPSNN